MRKLNLNERITIGSVSKYVWRNVTLEGASCNTDEFSLKSNLTVWTLTLIVVTTAFKRTHSFLADCDCQCEASHIYCLMCFCGQLFTWKCEFMSNVVIESLVVIRYRVYKILQNKWMRRCGVPPPPTNNFRKTKVTPANDISLERDFIGESQSF